MIIDNNKNIIFYVFFNYKYLNISGFIDIFNEKILITSYKKELSIEFIKRLLNTEFNISSCTRYLLDDKFKLLTNPPVFNINNINTYSNFELKHLKKFKNTYIKYNRILFTIPIYSSITGAAEVVYFNNSKFNSLSNLEEKIERIYLKNINNIDNLNFEFIENWCLMLNKEFTFNRFNLHYNKMKKTRYILDNYAKYINLNSILNDNSILLNLIRIIFSYNGMFEFEKDNFKSFYNRIGGSLKKYFIDNSLLYKNKYIKIFLFKVPPLDFSNKNFGFSKRRPNFINLIEIDLSKTNLNLFENFIKEYDNNIFIEIKSKLEKIIFNSANIYSDPII